MDRDETAADFWNQTSQVAAFSGSPGALAYETALIATSAELAATSGPVDDVRVVGVGTGRELVAVREILPDARILAYDISEPMVAACRAFVASTGLGAVDVELKDVVDLTESDGPTDLIVLVNAVLCYVAAKDRVRAIHGLSSVLRTGGSVAMVVHQRNGRPDWSAWFALRYVATRLRLAEGDAGDRRISHDRASMLFHHFTRRELRRLMSQAGFTDVAITTLRSWARSTGHRIPLGSPNPLLVSGRLPN